MAPRRRSSKAAIAAAWKSFYETPEGKAAVGAMMSRFGVFSVTPAADATQLAVMTGERNVCAWVAEQIGFKPNTYVDQRSEIDRILERYGADE